MKRFLFILSIFVTSFVFSQTSILNTTTCPKYVVTHWADADCNPLGTITSFAPSISTVTSITPPLGGHLVAAQIFDGVPGATGCFIISMVSPFTWCTTGPSTGSGVSCITPCSGVTIFGSITGSLGNELININ